MKTTIMKSYRIAASLVAIAFMAGNLLAQKNVSTFEMRYFTKDANANGVTDLHGETEVFDNTRRLAFLNSYASYA